MFEIYIDQAFLRELWSLNDEERNLVKDFFINIGSFAKFVLNVDSEEDIRSDEELDVIWSEFFAENLKTKYESDFLSEVHEGVKYYGLKLFFLGEGDETLDNSGYLHFTRNSLKGKLEKLKRYITTNRYFLSLDVTLDEVQREFKEFIFNSWDDLSGLSELPNNSIVIVDAYILSYPDRVKNNLVPLLKAIMPRNYEGKLDILIISENILRGREDIENLEVQKNKAKMVQGMLTSQLRANSLSYEKLTITIANLDKGSVPEDVVLHDRLVYTNYFRILFTSGIDVRQKSGIRKKVNSEIISDSNLLKHMLVTVPGHLNELNKFLNVLVSKEHIFSTYPEVFNNRLVNYSC
jgi:hypothetical protein